MKDRLPSLIRHTVRNEEKESDSESDLLEDNDVLEEQLNEETNEFLEQVLVQRHELVRLRHVASRVSQLHWVLLAALDSGAPDNDAVDEAIKRLDEQFADVDKISGSVCQAINRLKEDVRINCDSAADGRIRKDQLMALTESVRQVLLQFDKNYIDYEEASRARAVEYLKTNNFTEEERVLDFFEVERSTSDTRPQLIQSSKTFEAVLDYKGDELSISDDKPQLQRSVSVYEAVLSEVRERHETIEKVERSIEELGDLYHQLKMYVDVGNEMTNNIENNIELAGEFVEKTRENIAIVVEREETIRKGEGFVGKAIHSLRLLLIFLLIFLFLLIAIFLWIFTRRLSIIIH